MTKPKSDLIDELIEAAEEGDLAAIEKCLEGKRIEINVCDGDGTTALQKAAYHGHTEIVQYLLNHGAKAGLKNEDGETAANLAVNNDHNEIALLLQMAVRVQSIPEWSLAGSTKLVHVETSLPTGRLLTEIFNFESRERQLIAENLRTNSETVFMPTSFDGLPSPLIEKVLEKFKSLGGVADAEFVVNGVQQLQKNTFLKR